MSTNLLRIPKRRYVKSRGPLLHDTLLAGSHSCPPIVRRPERRRNSVLRRPPPPPVRIPPIVREDISVAALAAQRRGEFRRQVEDRLRRQGLTVSRRNSPSAFKHRKVSWGTNLNDARAHTRTKGPYIKDVRKIFGILDPLPPLSAFWLDL